MVASTLNSPFNYAALDDQRSKVLIERFGRWLLVGSEMVYGVFSYPTEEQVLARETRPAAGETMRALMRLPYLMLHRADCQAKIGQPVHVLCAAGMPEFEVAELEPSEAAIYRVTLREAQGKPVDTAGRKWQ